MYFRYLCNYLPLEKGGALHLNKLESLSSKDALCQVLLKLAQWFWRRRWKCEKFTTTTTTTTTITTTDKFWSEKPTWAFGSGELIMIVYVSSVCLLSTCLLHRSVHVTLHTFVLNFKLKKFYWSAHILTQILLGGFFK